MSATFNKLHSPAHVPGGWNADVDDSRNPSYLVVWHPSLGPARVPYEPADDIDGRARRLAQATGMTPGSARQLVVQVRIKLTGRELRAR
jgi:hypothetical protein